MARVKNNATDRMSGKVDQFVYRDRNGKTVASRKPDRSRVQASESQEAQRKRFRMATRYAKSVMDDPQLLALYEERAIGDISAYNLAVKDFMDAPRIEDINPYRYAGNINDKIEIAVDDVSPIATVYVKITKSDGSVVEQGQAVMKSAISWEYTCTALNAPVIGTIITVTAIDHPGNRSEQQKTM